MRSGDTYEDGKNDAFVDYAEAEVDGRVIMAPWLHTELSRPAQTTYVRGYQDGLRISINQTREAARAAAQGREPVFEWTLPYGKIE